MRVEVEDLVTGAEIARRLGWTRERIRQLTKLDGFPEPVGRAGVAILWRWSAIERWAEAFAASRGEQPFLETRSNGYIFRTMPGRPGFVEVYRVDGGRDGQAVAWPGTPIVELAALPSGVEVRTARRRGRILRNLRGVWALASADSIEPAAR